MSKKAALFDDSDEDKNDYKPSDPAAAGEPGGVVKLDDNEEEYVPSNLPEPVSDAPNIAPSETFGDAGPPKAGGKIFDDDDEPRKENKKLFDDEEDEY